MIVFIIALTRVLVVGAASPTNSQSVSPCDAPLCGSGSFIYGSEPPLQVGCLNGVICSVTYVGVGLVQGSCAAAAPFLSDDPACYSNMSLAEANAACVGKSSCTISPNAFNTSLPGPACAFRLGHSTVIQGMVGQCCCVAPLQSESQSQTLSQSVTPIPEVCASVIGYNVGLFLYCPQPSMVITAIDQIVFGLPVIINPCQFAANATCDNSGAALTYASSVCLGHYSCIIHMNRIPIPNSCNPGQTTTQAFRNSLALALHVTCT